MTAMIVKPKGCSCEGPDPTFPEAFVGTSEGCPTHDPNYELDFDARYTVDGYSGVAFYLKGWTQTWEPERYWIECDSDDDDGAFDDETGECGYWADLSDGEWVDDPSSGQVVAVMVGDDREHTVDVSDLTVIGDDDYCSGCGSTGCGWGH